MSVTLYLVHLTPRFRHAQHYLGVTRNGRSPEQRLEEHQAGAGAKMLRHAKNAGCVMTLARVWPDMPFASERRMKGRSLAPYCPICRMNGWKRKRAVKKSLEDLP